MDTDERKAKAPLTIQSVERALSILELLLRTGRSMTVIEICAEVGIQRTTLYALLNTLVALGYVIKQPRDGRYIISSKMYELSATYPHRLPIVQYIRPHLVALGQRFNTAVRISVPNWEGKFVPVMSTTSLQSLIASSTASDYPLHATSTGKLILAHQPPEKAAELLETMPLPRYTNATITDRTRLAQVVEEIRVQGYALDVAEYFSDTTCVSFPIENAQKDLLAVITLSENVEHMRQVMDNLLPAALQCSRLLSMELIEMSGLSADN